MTIDGTNITTYGLLLNTIKNHLNKPARKKTLDEPGFDAKDIVFKSQYLNVELVGVFETPAALLAGVEALKTKIKLKIEHDFTIARHGLTFKGVVADGMKVDTTKNILAKIYFKVTITG